MKKFYLLIGLLLATPAFAADNAVIVTPGVGVTIRSVDIGAGVQAPAHALVNASGTQIGVAGSELFVGGRGTAGTAAGGVLTVQGAASMTPLFMQSAIVPVSTMNAANASGLGAAISGVFDDTTPTAITENSFGFLRMSANRNLYGTIRDAAGNERGANVDASNRLTTAPTMVSGSVASGAYASGSVASGAFASGSIASGALASGSIASGAMVDLLTFQGTKNAGTAAANSLLTGGVYNSTPLTLTNTQQASLQFDVNGYLKVNTAAGAAAGGTSSNFGSAFPTPGTAAGMSDGTNMVAMRATTYGTAPTGLNALAVNAFVTNTNNNGRATAGNSSPVVLPSSPSQWHLIAANSTNATSVKGSAAVVFSCQLSGIGSTPAYLKIYNKATSPTVGTDTPVKTLIIPAASTAANGAGSNIQFGAGGMSLSTGFAAAVTGGIAVADTTAVAAATFAINCDYE